MRFIGLFIMFALGCGSNPTPIPEESVEDQDEAPPAISEQEGDGDDISGEGDRASDPREGEVEGNDPLNPSEGEGEGEEAPCPCLTDEDCQDGNICNGIEVCNQCVCQRSEPFICPDDGVGCTQGVCDPADGQCDYVPRHEWCSEHEICDVQQDCQGRPPCLSNDDCDSEDPCQTGMCNLETGTCEYRLVDSDNDTFASLACGGQDCGDDDHEIYPEAPERCNELDDDCDGQIDEGFDFDSSARHCGACNTECDAHLHCYGGNCQCVEETHTDCGQFCVDLQISFNDCGRCGNVCQAPLVRCVAGECRCRGDDDIFCNGECFDWRSTNEHCRQCNNRCPQGTRCTDGRCS